MLDKFVPRLLNHLLAQSNWARVRLRAQAGKQARFELGALSVNLVVSDDGYLADARGTSEPDVTLSLPDDLAHRLLQGQTALLAGVRITGDAELADTLGFVLRHLRWDAEEDLSHLFGDIIAHRAVTGLQRIASGLPRLVQGASENLARYLTEENGTLLARADLEAHASDLANLRDALARCEKRIDRL